MNSLTDDLSGDRIASVLYPRLSATDEDLQALVKKWQAILRLQDWDVRVRFVRHHEFSTPVNGDCKMWKQKKRADIRILHPQDQTQNPDDLDEECIENTLVHELIHLHVWWFDYRFDTPEEDHLEQAINALANALIGLNQRLTPKGASG